MMLYIFCLSVYLFMMNVMGEDPKPQTKWDKQPLTDLTYSKLPSDLQAMVDKIVELDKTYEQKSGMYRCFAFVNQQELLVPLVTARYMGETFRVLGPNGEEAELKLQTGFYFNKLDTVWKTRVKCAIGLAVSTYDSDTAKPMMPLFYG